jgi:hypothetical protein
MIAYLIIFASFFLEISLGGFLGMRGGPPYILSSAFIILSSFLPPRDIFRIALLSGILADFFLSSFNFFGVILVVYLVLAYFMVWVRFSFSGASLRQTVFLRISAGTIFYFMISLSIAALAAFYSNEFPWRGLFRFGLASLVNAFLSAALLFAIAFIFENRLKQYVR